ncbi:hypothetical protein F5B20DRAFT_582399 [Whalleya microplaca]|nr:hypothetical protein F5B20DRAFT_582399 [Whalleya microplaca]
MSFYNIDSSGDLVLSVVELDHRIFGEGGRHPIKKTRELRVSSAKIEEHTNILDIAPEKKERRIIHDESIKAVRLWMDTFHGNGISYRIDIKMIWAAIRFGQKYLKTRKRAVERYVTIRLFRKDWSDIKEAELLQLLSPAYWFDCGKLFGEITKALVYQSTGYLTENYNPTKFMDEHMMRVPDPVIRQLQAAKGNLRLQIHPYSFMKSLIDSGSFPVNSQQNRKKSVNDFLSCIRAFKLEVVKIEVPRIDGKEWKLIQENISVLAETSRSNDDVAKSNDVSRDRNDTPKTASATDNQRQASGPKFSSEACNRCENWLARSSTLEWKVHKLAGEIERKFDGLCLDCMHKFKTGDEDCDYWEHARLRQYDHGCRFKHGQPTWYFSYMGRRETMNKFQDRNSKASKGTGTTA